MALKVAGSFPVSHPNFCSKESNMLRSRRIILMVGMIVSMFGAFSWGDEPKNKYKTAKIYDDLRQMVLTVKPEKLGLTPSSTNRVYGLLMETGYKDAVITLVSLADGTVSLYFSNGGGFIGVGQHKGPRQTSDALLAASPDFLSQASLVQSFPLPSTGNTCFYFLTFDGIYSIEVKESDLGNNKLPLSPLFAKAQDVITQLRLWDERRKALLGAAARGEVSNIKKLLELDPVLLDSKDDTGLTPLMAAGYSGQEDAVKVLLDSKVLIDVKDKEGLTALMFAANAGKLACVKLLLEAGASVNEQANDGSTPIMYAAQHGYNDVVRLLLEHRADPAITGKHGLSAIGFAKQNGLKETEKILLEKR